jgi:hypothetical protein
MKQQQMVILGALVVMLIMMLQKLRHQQKSDYVVGQYELKCRSNGSVCGGYSTPCKYCCNNHTPGNKHEWWGVAKYCKDDIAGKKAKSDWDKKKPVCGDRWDNQCTYDDGKPYEG